MTKIFKHPAVALAFIVLAMGIVGRFDYEDARMTECYYKHMGYDSSLDLCIAEAK